MWLAQRMGIPHLIISRALNRLQNTYTEPFLQIHTSRTHGSKRYSIRINGELQGTSYNKPSTSTAQQSAASALAQPNESLPAAPILLGQGGKTFSLSAFTLREGALPFNATK